jgi:outer membrane protein TolC
MLRASLAHPSVSASRLQVEAARDLLSAEHDRYWGTGGASVATSRYEDQRFVGVLSPTTLTNLPFDRDITTYGVFYRLPIDLAGAIAAAKRAATHDLTAAQLDERQTSLLTLHSTTSAYVRLQALERRNQVLAIQRERVQQTVERVTQQVVTEQASIAELRLAEAELARLEADEERLAGAVEEALAALEEASGQRGLPASTDILVPSWPDYPDESLQPVALARARSESATARAEASRRSLLPKVSVGADYFQFESGADTPDAWSINASVTVPLDPAGWKRSSAARAQAEAAEQLQQAALRQSQRNWVTLKASYQAALADAQASAKEIEARQEVVRVQAELQRVGMETLENFNRQQRDLLEAESRRASATANAVISWSAAQVLIGSQPGDYISALDQSSPNAK